MRSRLLFGFGIFTVSTGMLLSELLLMRLLSFMLWHHLAYLIISMALLGLAVGGTLSMLLGARLEKTAHFWMTLFSGIAAVLMILSVFIISLTHLDTFMLDVKSLISLVGSYALLALPFACGGFVLSTAFSTARKQIGRLYAFDLLGAAVGSILFFLVIQALGAPLALAAAACLLALGGVLFAFDGKNRQQIILSIMFFLLLAAFSGPISRSIPVLPAQTKQLAKILADDPNAEIKFTQWTPIGRIDLVSSNLQNNPFDLENEPAEDIMAITIDGDATTWMFHHPDARTEPPEKDETDINTYHLAMLLLDQPSVLIIGPGGSNEIYASIEMEASAVTGVEINPAILQLSTDDYADFVGNVYDLAYVDGYAAEGRSYIRRTDTEYDLIQMSGVDTWTGLSSGAYVLSENYLYTVEGFTEYLSHLNEGGIFSIERWSLSPPRESLRMVSLACEALRNLGVSDPGDHIILLRHADPRFIRMLVSVSPFSEDDIEILAETIEPVSGEIIAGPGVENDTQYNQLIAAYAKGKEEVYFVRYPYAVNPVYDDRPFFFEYYKWNYLFHDLFNPTGDGSIGSDRPIALVILFAILVQALILTLLFIFLPLKILQKRKHTSSLSARPAVYFAAIGIGYMFVEISLMQRYVLYLGHPSYSIPVVLASLLGASALGSRLSQRIFKENRSIRWLLFLPALILLAAVGLPGILNSTLGTAFSLRILITILTTAIPGVLMGMMFPLGIQAVSQSGKESVAWAWSVNASASVIGSVGVIIVSMLVGFTAALVLAAVLYVLTVFVFPGSLAELSSTES